MGVSSEELSILLKKKRKKETNSTSWFTLEMMILLFINFKQLNDR